MVQNAIPSHKPRYTPRLVCSIDYGFDQWLVVNFVIKNPFYVFIYGKKCICLFTHMCFMQIYFYLLWFWNKIAHFFVFAIFLLTLHNVNYEAKQSSETIQEVNMIKLNLRASNVRVSMSSNFLYFNLRSHVFEYKSKKL